MLNPDPIIATHPELGPIRLQSGRNQEGEPDLTRSDHPSAIRHLRGFRHMVCGPFRRDFPFRHKNFDLPRKNSHVNQE